MSFLLYKIKSDNSSNTLYDLVDEIELSGNNGPFALYVNEKSDKENTVFKWEMRESLILKYLNLDEQGHAIIANIKPKSNKYVALCRLDRIWGYSSDWWTPILVRLNTIYFDRADNDPRDFIKHFDDSEAENEILHEFLYLQGGIIHRGWGWGPTGAVNAPLLWPDPLLYFYNILSDFVNQIKQRGN